MSARPTGAAAMVTGIPSGILPYIAMHCSGLNSAKVVLPVQPGNVHITTPSAELANQTCAVLNTQISFFPAS